MADRAISLAGPDRLDRTLGWLALALLAVVLVALVRGSGHWGEVSLPIWVHIVTILTGLALTPVMMWRRRGDSTHRTLGYVWVVSLALAALSSFLITATNPGHFSVIHLLSIWTMVQLPVIVLAARRRNHPRHRRAVRGMIIGALLIAGFFTLPFGRMLGRWLMG